METELRLVIDTNVYVSALLKRGGKPARMVDYALDNAELIASPETWGELIEVIGRPKFKPYVSEGRIEKFSWSVYRETTMVYPQKKHTLSPDPKDNKFIDAAVAGRAHIILSGDRRHLLSLGHAEGIPILSVNDFTQSLDETRREGSAASFKTLTAGRAPEQRTEP